MKTVFSLEDMKKAFEYYTFTSVSNQPYNDFELEEQFEKFIQSLSTMKLEDHKKQIDDFLNSHTPEQLKEKWDKYNYLSKPKKAFSLYDVISSNLALLWWGWCTVWGIVGIIFGLIKLWNYCI